MSTVLTLLASRAGGGGGATTGGNATSGGAAPGASSAAPKGESAGQINTDITSDLEWIWLALALSFFIYQLTFHLVRYIRAIVCLTNDTQRYFAKPNSWYSRFKKYLLDAPLFRTRHHREFKLSTAVNVGTLPSRLQTIALVGYFAINVAFCVIRIDFSQPETKVAPVLRNRFGVLCVLNMIPLFLFAGRNNPLIKLCGISFDTFNLLHRWIGRIVALEGIGHVLAWMIPNLQTMSFSDVMNSIGRSQFFLSGGICVLAFIVLLISSPSAIRHAVYETFLHIHIAAIATAVGALYFHLKDLPQIGWLWAAIGLWIFDRSMRLFRVLYRNIGNGGTKVEVEALPGDAVRVTMWLARPWRFRPGQHAYIYLPSVGLWTSHPFSLAWSEQDGEAELSPEKGLPVSRQDVLSSSKTSMSFVVRRRTGFTDSLFKKASGSATGKFTATGFIEGPYGGHSLNSYGTVMLWAAGIGITHQVPYVRSIVAAYANGATATRRLTLVWIIQSPEHLEWIRPWMTSILNMPRRREILKILLFVTRPRSTKEIHSPSSSVQMFPGKPNVQSLLDQEMAESLGAAVVTTCGTGALADDLRRAVRNRQEMWNVDFKEESFSW